MSNTNNEYFGTIRKAKETNKLAIFVGCGASIDSNLPSWGDLIGSMKRSLEDDKLSDYLKVAEFYHIQYGRNKYYNKINEYFPADSQPNTIHELILKLKPQHIVTTNWDNLLEKAINNNSESYFPVATDHELASSPISKLLIKMHGDLSHRNIVFKESDYFSYSDNFPLIENFIKSIFSTFVVLFVGYSINDNDLNQILRWIQNRTNDAPPSFSILTEKTISMSEATYLRNKGVFPILCDFDGLATKEVFSKLSPKGQKVAYTLEMILNPKIEDIEQILFDISEEIKCWENIFPANFIQLIRDRFNITTINKIYYDSSENVVCYRLANEEKSISRKTYRKIRKSLKEILACLAIKGFAFEYKFNKRILISNPKSFFFESEFTTFNFSALRQRTAAYKTNFSSDLELGYQHAFDLYFLRKIHVCRDLFQNLANLYFAKSQYTKALISAFNKKHAVFGEVPLEISNEVLNQAMEEQLSINDNITEIMEKFPKSLIAGQKGLFQGLDSNNSVLLERFNTIVGISRELEKEIKDIKNGGIVFSSRLSQIHNQLFLTTFFILQNKLTVLFSAIYKNICQVSFETMINRQLLEKEIKISEVLAFSAIIGYKEKDLERFVINAMQQKRFFVLLPGVEKYLIIILENTLKELLNPESRTLQDYSNNIWKNTLFLLSFCKPDKPLMKEIINHLISAFKIQNWFKLSESINRFIVFQVKRYDNNLELNDLKELLNIQIEKLTQHPSLPLEENGLLFSNLLYLIKDSNDDEKQNILADTAQINGFLARIENMQLDDKIKAVNGFLFVIHSLAKEQLKNKVAKIMTETYKESKTKRSNERTVMLGLDLFHVNVIGKSELKLIMNLLGDIAKKSLDKGSTNSQFSAINKQLELIKIPQSKKNKDIIKMIKQLSDQIEKSLFGKMK